MTIPQTTLPQSVQTVPPVDFDRALAVEADRVAQTRSLNALCRERLFSALAAKKIDHITVSFDGEGDSGQIEEISAFAADKEVPLPDGEIGVPISFHGDHVEEQPQSFTDAIENLCYDLLAEEHGGWENNDGAFGEFTFDVAERRVSLGYHSRFVSSDFSEYEW